MSLNNLCPIYFTKDFLKYCYIFRVSNVNGLDCVKVSNLQINDKQDFYKSYESCLLQFNEEYHYYALDDFMEIYLLNKS